MCIWDNASYADKICRNEDSPPLSPPPSTNWSVNEWNWTNHPLKNNFLHILPPEKIIKPYGFLMLSGGREKVHWEKNRLSEGIIFTEYFLCIICHFHTSA